MANDPRPTTNDKVSRIAYLECFSGISGDMFLGALIDAGVSSQILQQTAEALGVGARLEISQVNRSGVSATKVDVVVLPDTHASQKRSHDAGRTGASDRQGLSHEHSHTHKHSHDDAQGHTHDHAMHSHEHQHGRGLKEIREIIAGAQISESAIHTAIAIFEKLGAAESKIHNVPIEKIHFHEVGAVDALVDIVCAAAGAEALGVDQFVCSPLNVGGGTVECAHGTFPIPAPATVELLKGAPVYSSGIQAELVTPTGAAIVATLVKRFEPFPALKIDGSGYGAGTRDFQGHPNVLRITVGEEIRARAGSARATLEHTTQTETVAVLEANLDDLSPQVFGYAMDRLLESGALDVFGMPVQMKKNRPGVVLTVLARPQDADQLAKIIFNETTTLGIRRREEQRQVLTRKWETVSTRFGEVRIKIANMNGLVSNYAPEYEDCRRIAAEKGVPLKTVMADAVEAYANSRKR